MCHFDLKSLAVALLAVLASVSAAQTAKTATDQDQPGQAARQRLRQEDR